MLCDSVVFDKISMYYMSCDDIIKIWIPVGEKLCLNQY